MAINKVVLNNEVQLDLTADTVDASHLATGYTAHNSAGELITGTMSGGSGNTLFQSMVNRSITTVTASDLADITTIGNYAFCECKNLSSITLPDSITTIGKYAFKSCPLRTISFPDGLTSLGSYAFSGCMYFNENTNIVIPSGITTIEDFTFYYSSIESVVLPNVSTINSQAFGSCTRLKSMTLKYDGVVTAQNYFLGYSTSIKNIYVPAKHLASYKTATYWSDYADRIKPYDAYVEDNLPNQAITYGQTKTITVPLQNYETAPTTYSVTSTNTNFLGVINVSATKDAITFDIVGNGYQQTATTGDINISIEGNDITFERSFTVTIYTSFPESTWKVTTVTNAPYAFALNDDGYYQSANKGVGNSYAMANIVIKNVKGKKVYIDCINSGESNTDFGILSEVNKQLLLNYNIDTENVKKSFKGSSYNNPVVQTVEYDDAITTGVSETCSIYVKYRKDASGNYGKDTLQFTVRFEED